MQIAILFDYLNAKGPIFDHGRHGKKIKYKCLNEMKCLIYTLLYLVYTVLDLVLHHFLKQFFLFLYFCGGEQIQT